MNSPVPFRLELPFLPPTTNDLYNPLLIAGRARLVKSSEGRLFCQQLKQHLKLQQQLPAQPFEGPLALSCVFWVPTIASDVSNRVKALEDALTEAGVWHDDKQVAELHLMKMVGEPLSLIIIAPAPEPQAELVARLASSQLAREKRQRARLGEPQPNIRRART